MEEPGWRESPIKQTISEPKERNHPHASRFTPVKTSHQTQSTTTRMLVFPPALSCSHFVLHRSYQSCCCVDAGLICEAALNTTHIYINYQPFKAFSLVRASSTRWQYGLRKLISAIRTPSSGSPVRDMDGCLACWARPGGRVHV